MNAMTILNRCRAAERDMAEIEERIRQRRDAMTMLSAAPGREGGQGPARDRMAETAAAIADMERQLEDRRARHAVELVAVSALSETLDGAEGRVVYLYYGKGLTARAVARRLKYTEGYIRQLRKRAEDRLREIEGERLMEYAPAWYLNGTDKEEA